MALVVHHPAQEVPTRAARRACSGIRQVHLIERRLHSSATVATLCEVLECQPATCWAGKARMQWPGYAASSGRWNSTGRGNRARRASTKPAFEICAYCRSAARGATLGLAFGFTVDGPLGYQDIPDPNLLIRRHRRMV